RNMNLIRNVLTFWVTVLRPEGSKWTPVKLKASSHGPPQHPLKMCKGSPASSCVLLAKVY
ncbi:497_t:CDS:2, partial [Ambispora leptoticha]